MLFSTFYAINPFTFAIYLLLGDIREMWSNLTKPLSISAITAMLFASLLIGMTLLSENDGAPWGLKGSMPPEQVAEESFENGDYRLLSIRLKNMDKGGQRLNLGASCWPESLNTIDYEVNFAIQREPERGAHTKRVEYARKYNLRMACLLKGIGRECKIWNHC